MIKVGSHVIIKNSIKIDEIVGGVIFSNGMSILKRKILKVNEFVANDIFKVEGYSFYFHEDMVEEVFNFEEVCKIAKEGEKYRSIYTPEYVLTNKITVSKNKNSIVIYDAEEETEGCVEVPNNLMFQRIIAISKYYIVKVKHKPCGKEYDFILDIENRYKSYREQLKERLISHAVVCKTSLGLSFGVIQDCFIQEMSNEQASRYSHCSLVTEKKYL